MRATEKKTSGWGAVLFWQLHKMMLLLCLVVMAACAHNPYAGRSQQSGFHHFEPSVVQIARMRASGGTDDPFTQNYRVTDRDVLDYTDHVKSVLSEKLTTHTTVRLSSSSLQVLLSSMIALVPAFGWSASSASIMGGGSSFIHGMGQNIDAKGRAQAYETALTAIQKAESTFYFYRTGMKFSTDTAGKKTVDYSNAVGSSEVPSSTMLTPDGETLYFRVTKNLQILEDALASKIPNLQDLKDAQGDTSATTTSAAPAK